MMLHLLRSEDKLKLELEIVVLGNVKQNFMEVFLS